MPEDVIGIFIGLFFFAVVIIIIGSVIAKASQLAKGNQHMDDYKRKKAEEDAAAIAEARKKAEERRRKAAEMRSIAHTFGLDEDETAKKHSAHVADSHAHGHTGDEEHYEEIVGSLGEVNDEGCADLNGVRFIANDLAYEIQSQDNIDYDRIAQAMVLGEIINSPRFKTPYSKRK